MNIKEIFKKYWFVMAVGVLLLVFVIAFAVSTQESKDNEEILPTASNKVVDGKYVLFDIDGKNEYFADDYYDSIDKSQEISIVLNDLLTIISEKEIKMTEEIKTMAVNAASYQFSNSTAEEIEDLMRTNGLKKYGNITNYFEKEYRNQMLIREYLTNHKDDVVADYLEETPIKKISHILVKVADVKEETDESGNTVHVANPTQEESDKLNQVLEALKTKEFAEVAKEFSEDGSAADGGFLSNSTDDEAASSYVSEFAEGVKNATYGEPTDVITSQYGYHIILVEEVNVDDIVNDMSRANDIMAANNSGNYIDMLAEYANKLNIKIVDEDIIEIFNTIGTVKLNGQEDVSTDTTETTEESEASE